MRIFWGCRRAADRKRCAPPLRTLALEAMEARALLATSPAAAVPGANAVTQAVTPEVAYAVQTLEPGTHTPISSILAGRDFDMQVLVQDLRDPSDPNRGVFAGYLDLLYDKSLARARVAEVQTLSIAGTTSGSFQLTFNGQTTQTITFDLLKPGGSDAMASSIQGALNSLLGQGMVRVTEGDASFSFDIRWVGQFDVAEPLLQATMPFVAIIEKVKGDPTNAASFTEAFRSQSLGLNDGLPSPYQNGLSAIDGPDRVDELGAFGFASGTRLVELVRGRFRAILPAGQTTGELSFTPDFSDIDSPVHNTLVFANVLQNEKDHVLPDAIDGEAAQLTIDRALVAAPGSASIDEDAAAGVVVSVLQQVTKNAAAPSGAVELRSFTQPAMGGTVTRLDPNHTPNDLSDDRLLFVPAANFNGTVSFTYTADIAGDAFVEDIAASTITVTVNAVNDLPVITVPPAQNIQEDTPLVFSAAKGNAASVVDVDADAAAANPGLQMTLTAAGGTVTLGATAGLTFSVGDGAADGVMTFTGPTAAINAALAGLVFTPIPDFNGAASLSITANDRGNIGKPAGVSLQDQKTIAINVAAVNDTPVITAPAVQNVYSIDPLVFSPALGNAITISDVDAGTDQMRVMVVVGGPLGLLSVTAVPGVLLLGNNSGALTILGSQAAINATLNGLTLAPPQLSFVTGSITVTAFDQGHNPAPGMSEVKTILIHGATAVTPFAVDDAPTGLVEGSGSYSIDVLANDLADAGARPMLVSFTQPAVGTVTLDNNGTPSDATDDKLIYHVPPKNGQPDLDFFTPGGVSPISFTYQVNEPPGNAKPDSPPATVVLRIANVADAPVANSDGVSPLYATVSGVGLTKDAAHGLLSNDADIDNSYGASVATLSVLGASDGNPLAVNTTGGGTATLNADGSFSYTPAAHFSGNDSFTYRAHSSLGLDSNLATVTIHVSAPPVAANDTFTAAQEDQPFLSPTSVLANDSDPSDGEPLAAVLVSDIAAAAGTLVFDASGFFRYTPAANFNTTQPAAAPVTFTYQAVGASGRRSPPATVSITVNEVNDKPTASDDNFRAARKSGQLGTDQIITVLDNDTIAADVGETLTVTAINGVVADASGNAGPVATSFGGSVRLDHFQVKYSSPAVLGDDSFTYTIGDGRGGTATATVHILIAPLYDFGDAPDSYGTSFAVDGARHVAIGPQLGPLRDEEVDAMASADAKGDDTTGAADEDGLVSYALIRGKASSVTVNVVSAGGSARLDAWIDFNHDGTFSASEKISDSVVVNSGNAQANFTVPATAQLGQTFARLRISTAGGLGPTGLAADGEVEDTRVNVFQDLEADFSASNTAHNVSIRQDGANVEIVDADSGAVIDSSPLANTPSIIVRGSATQPDEVTVDYSAGGFFTLPGGIQLDGGASGSDKMILQGTSNASASAHYVSAGLSLGNATLQTHDGTVENDIQLSNFEPLIVRGVASFDASGDLNVGPDVLTLEISSPPTLSALTTLAGGAINASGGIHLAAGETLRGAGMISGRVAADAGSTIEATGDLKLGDATSPSGFVTQGVLRTNGNTVTLLSADAAVLGSLTTLGDLSLAGTLNTASGLMVGAGNQITGHGTIVTPSAGSKPLVIFGSIVGTSAGQRITLSGYVTGTGPLDNVAIAGTLHPAANPTTVHNGNVSYAASGRLVASIGGTTAGSGYDQQVLSGVAGLDGTLELNLVNGFVPHLGDSFRLMTAAGGVRSAFRGTVLPALAEFWFWQFGYHANDLTIVVATTHQWHNSLKPFDVNGDGQVVAGDALAVINFVNAFGSIAVPATAAFGPQFYDTDGDNQVSPADALAVINAVNAGLGGEGEGEGQETGYRSQGTGDGLLALLAEDVAQRVANRRKTLALTPL